jgi:hypothetical protein
MQQVIDQAMRQAARQTVSDLPPEPTDLAERIAEAIKGTRDSWDKALWNIVNAKQETRN